MDAIIGAVILTTSAFLLYTGQVLGTWWTRLLAPHLTARSAPLVWILAGVAGRITVFVPGVLMIGLPVSATGVILALMIGTTGQIAGNRTPTQGGVIARVHDPDERGPWSLVWVLMSAGVIALTS